jgi:predicted nucleic acid-binding protein
MDVSLDTDITIHLYEAGKEELLFKYFDKLYMHEFILEREIKNKSITVYNRIKGEIEEGRIIKVTQRYLIELGMKTTFENLLYEIKVLFDYGEANAVALAAALGISALVTDDTKDFGPHETLVREYIENIMPFAFYELLYLEYLQSDDDFNEFENSYDEINYGSKVKVLLKHLVK